MCVSVAAVSLVALSGQGEEIDALILNTLGQLAHSPHRYARAACGASGAPRGSRWAAAYDAARELQWARAENPQRRQALLASRLHPDHGHVRRVRPAGVLPHPHCQRDGMGRRASRVWWPVARLAASRGNTPLSPPMAGVQGALSDRSAAHTHSTLISPHDSTHRPRPRCRPTDVSPPAATHRQHANRRHRAHVVPSRGAGSRFAARPRRHLGACWHRAT